VKPLERTDGDRALRDKKEEYLNIRTEERKKTDRLSRDTHSYTASKEKEQNKTMQSKSNPANKSSKGDSKKVVISENDSKFEHSTNIVKKSHVGLTTARPRTEGSTEGREGFGRSTEDEVATKIIDARYKPPVDGSKFFTVSSHVSSRRSTSSNNTPHYLSATDGSYIVECDLDESVGSLSNRISRTTLAADQRKQSDAAMDETGGVGLNNNNISIHKKETFINYNYEINIANRYKIMKQYIE